MLRIHWQLLQDGEDAVGSSRTVGKYQSVEKWQEDTLEGTLAILGKMYGFGGLAGLLVAELKVLRLKL